MAEKQYLVPPAQAHPISSWLSSVHRHLGGRYWEEDNAMHIPVSYPTKKNIVEVHKHRPDNIAGVKI